MKKILIVLVVLVSLAACKDKEKTNTENTSKTKDNYLESSNKDKTNTNSNTSTNNSTDQNSGDSWTKAQVSEFVETCVTAAEKGKMTHTEAENYCSCMQQKLEKKYPNANDASGLTEESPELQQMAQQCAPGNSSNTGNTGNPGGWTKADEAKFMDDCRRTATPKIGAVRANENCGCVLAKLERLYSSYAEADRVMAGFTEKQGKDFVAECDQ